MRRKHLTNARHDRGLAAIDLAELIGTNEQHIYAVERGRYKPRRDIAALWAKALRMPAEIAFPELFNREAER